MAGTSFEVGDVVAACVTGGVPTADGLLPAPDVADVAATGAVVAMVVAAAAGMIALP